MATKVEAANSRQLTGFVREVMTGNVQCANAATSIAEVADQMTENALRRIVIVNQRRHVVGVVSQRDILKRYISSAQTVAKDERGEEVPWDSFPVRELITRENPVTVSPDLPLQKAAVVLGANKIGCLPVVENAAVLVGLLTITDLLQHVTGRSAETLESAFQFYTPSKESRAKMPAYIRKVNGELVIPLKCIERPEAAGKFASLGYDPPTGRVLVKFLSEGNLSDGTMKTRVEDGCLVIEARGFVNHFDLAGRINAFDVSAHKNDSYLVLSPRQNQSVTLPPTE